MGHVRLCMAKKTSNLSRRTALPVAAGLVAICLGLAACTNGTQPTSAAPSSTTTTIPLKSVGLISAGSFVKDRVVLTKHSVRAGTTIAGTLIVTNGSTNPVNLTSGCAPDYAVVIRNRMVQQ